MFNPFSLNLLLLVSPQKLTQVGREYKKSLVQSPAKNRASVRSEQVSVQLDLENSRGWTWCDLSSKPSTLHEGLQDFKDLVPQSLLAGQVL